MTKPLSEPSVYKDVGRGVWRVNQLERRPIPEASGVALWEIEVFQPDVAVVVGDEAFRWHVPTELDGAVVLGVEGSLATAGTGSTQVQIRLSDPCDVGTDILSTKLTIDTGECNSIDSATQPVISGTPTLTAGDHLHIDVDQAATGALGMTVSVVVAPSALASVAIQGMQGAPGGVTQWQGGWTTTTVYQEGDIVIHNGTVYVVTDDHTSGGTTEPGVGVDWEDFLAPLFETAVYSGFDVVMHGGGGLLASGIKAYVPVPFDCEIIEATLLADQAGSCVVDIWKDTYGNYPPTNADSITSATPPTLSGANKTTNTALSGWTTSLAYGDVLAVVVESISSINFLTLGLRLLRTP